MFKRIIKETLEFFRQIFKISSLLKKRGLKGQKSTIFTIALAKISPLFEVAKREKHEKHSKNDE